MYSGPIAATGYAALASARETVQRVVLLGPAHSVRVGGLAVSGADAFATPLGDVPSTPSCATACFGLPGVVVDDAAHAPEHSLEVHLPFLQRARRLHVLPLVVGRATPTWSPTCSTPSGAGPRPLIVVSTDLSHYLDYDAAMHDATAHRERHRQRRRSTTIAPDDACGAAPVRGLLAVAQRRDLQAQLLDLRNSGDTAGPRDRVVGYGAFRVWLTW